MKTFSQKLLLTILLSLSSHQAVAKDFGTRGMVFEIEEVDMLLYIKSRLAALEESGGIEKLNKDMQDRTKNYVYEPAPIEGITKASKRRVRLYDPTYIVDKDIYDQDGELMHERGKVINPLDHAPWPVNLLFIDGSDKEQVNWALEESNATNKLSKIVLVKGRPVDLMKKHQLRVYFDQKGLLSKRLGIEKVPSKVQQKGNMLEIIEEKVK